LAIGIDYIHIENIRRKIMGYTTDFGGSVTIEPALKDEHREFLIGLANTRRMKRDAVIAETLDDPVRIAAGLPIGEDGEFFIGADGFKGQTDDASVQEYNCPPENQPGLWCQWVPTEDGDGLEWDGGEKFYNYIEWMEYIIEKLLKPWGYTVNGEIEWFGEDYDDRGIIVVENNDVDSKIGRVVYD
jgi:hypothetical protein